jgi:flagellar hook-associated protein 3 FlgL
VRITSGMMQRHVLADLRQVQERLSAAQDQVSSGKRIERPSDDPLGAERATRLRDQLETTSSYSTAVDESKSWLDATDSALSSLGDLVQRARELTVQAANGATTPSARQSIKAEIDQLAEQAKTTLNGAYDGRYLFSGTATDQPPYTAATGDAYQGDAGQVLRQIGPGATVKVNVTGNDVLAGLLPALRTLSTDLASNNTTALQGTDLQAIDSAFDTVTNVRAQVGATTNRVQAAATRLSDLHDLTTSLLSSTEDADLPKALTDLATQQNALQSALRAGANLIQPSLLDFLQ